MSSPSVCFVDHRIEEAFKNHVKLSNEEEVEAIVTRFYELYYTRGKSLRTSISNSLVGTPTTSRAVLYDELRDLVSRF